MNVCDLVLPSGRFNRLQQNMDALSFCLRVYDEFQAGKSATKDMDKDKALEQLLDATRCLVKS